MSHNTFPVTLSSSAVNQSASNFTTTFAPPIEFNPNDKYSVALANIGVWNTYRNISAAAGNNSLRWSPNGTTWNTITFPDGLWAFGNQVSYIAQTITAQGGNSTYAVLSADDPTGGTIWTLSNGYQIDLTVSKYYIIIGWNSQIISTNGVNISPNQANVSNGLTNFYVTLSCINASGSFLNGIASTVIYSYGLGYAPQSLISLTPTYPLFVPVSSGTIQNLTITITDQNGNIIQLQNPGDYQNNPTSVTLYFKRENENIGEMLKKIFAKLNI